MTDINGNFSINYSYVTGKPKEGIYQGCYIYVYAANSGYPNSTGGGDLKKKKDVKNFKLYK